MAAAAVAERRAEEGALAEVAVGAGGVAGGEGPVVDEGVAGGGGVPDDAAAAAGPVGAVEVLAGTLSPAVAAVAAAAAAATSGDAKMHPAWRASSSRRMRSASSAKAESRCAWKDARRALICAYGSERQEKKETKAIAAQGDVGPIRGTHGLPFPVAKKSSTSRALMHDQWSSAAE